eukprot:gene11095-14890_t
MDQTSETEKIYQRNKYLEIIEILLTAGYFRARIQGLSEFDKVVGGLCWCITSSGEIVDVDILFQENSTIGQKISLSEAIVTALRKMGCPSPLQPHQIQGGVGGADYPAIYQVIVWLIKKYFERRGEREQQLRSYSTFQFSKNYKLPTEINDGIISNNLSKIMSRNKAVRLYKRRETSKESKETRVRSCLIEFGETFSRNNKNEDSQFSKVDDRGITASSLISNKKGEHSAVSNSSGGAFVLDKSTIEAEKSKLRVVPVVDSVDVTLAGLSKLDVTELSGFEKQLAKVARESKKEDLLFAQQISKEETELMKQMSEIDGDSSAAGVSGSQVGNIVGLSSSEIGSAQAAYMAQVEESKKQVDSSLASGKLGKTAAFNRQKQSLLKQRDEIIVKESTAQLATENLTEKLRLLEEERDGAIEYAEQLKAQLKKLSELEANATQQNELKLLKDLISLNESLKGQEGAFKASCKQQLNEYNERIKKLEKDDEEDNEENKKLRDVEDMHSKVEIKYNRLRQLLAETNLDVANSVRTIDDIPTRTELIQYERRFTELYQQVTWKLDETRNDNFAEAMKSNQSKNEFSKQFETIVRGVEDSLKKQENVLLQKDQKVEDLKVVHQSLVEDQRRYFKAVKDFQDECNKNDWLTAKMEQLSRQQ